MMERDQIQTEEAMFEQVTKVKVLPLLYIDTLHEEHLNVLHQTQKIQIMC